MITQQQENVDSSLNVRLESLSVCMDGELHAAHREELLAQFEADEALQTEWSLYHCIGDVLRSEELSCHSQGFSARFAARLADEPHVFAPRAARAVAAAQADARKSRWVKPLSLAASMAAVAVVAGVAMQQWNGSGAGNVNVATTVQPAGVQQVSQTAPMTVPGAYLTAHRQYASQRTALYVQTVAQDSGK